MKRYAIEYRDLSMLSVLAFPNFQISDTTNKIHDFEIEKFSMIKKMSIETLIFKKIWFSYREI